MNDMQKHTRTIVSNQTTSLFTAERISGPLPSAIYEYLRRRCSLTSTARQLLPH